MEGRRATRSKISEEARAKQPVPAKKSPTRKSPSRKSTGKQSPIGNLSIEHAIKTRGRPRKADKKTTLVEQKSIVNENVKEKDPVVTLHRLSPTIVSNITLPRTESPHHLTPTPSEHSRTTVSRSASRSVFDEGAISEHSDSEVEALFSNYKSNSRSSDTKNEDALYARQTPRTELNYQSEFGGSLGALLLIAMLSVGAYFVQFICTRDKCFCFMPRIQKLKSIGMIVTMESSSTFLLYTWIVFVLNMLPLGRMTTILTSRGLRKYRFTGLVKAILIFLFIIIAEYLDYSIIKLIARNYNRLLSTAILAALVQALWTHMLSNYKTIEFNYQNRYALNGRFLSQYLLGKDCEPEWVGRVNVKLMYLSMAATTTLIFCAIFIHRNLKFTPHPVSPIDAENQTSFDQILSIGLHYHRTTTYDPVALLITGLVCLYQLDALIFERHLGCSFELQYEGFGAFALLRYAIYPHFNCLMAKYALEHRLHNVPLWAMWFIAVIFVFGLWLKRYSNRMKYLWAVKADKSNSYDKLGCGLLISWPWGKLRHPNYLGDILCQTALVIPLIWHFAWPPLVPALFTIGLLLHRTKRTEERAANRYHSAWRLYCNHAKYKILPYIY